MECYNENNVVWLVRGMNAINRQITGVLQILSSDASGLNAQR